MPRNPSAKRWRNTIIIYLMLVGDEWSAIVWAKTGWLAMSFNVPRLLSSQRP